MQATDLDTTAIYEAGQRTPGQACEFLVPFEPLNKLVKGGKGPVQLELSDNNRVRVTTFIGTSPMEQTLDTLPVKEFPVQPTVNGEIITTSKARRRRSVSGFANRACLRSPSEARLLPKPEG